MSAEAPELLEFSDGRFPHISSILRGDIAPRPTCSNCRISETNLNLETADKGSNSDGHKRMMRCARCKVAHYCSPTCQKKHFAFHKELCKSVHRMEQSLPQLQVAAATREEMDATCQQLGSMGDILIVMGYKETDTLKNGSAYYRRALQVSCRAADLLLQWSTREDTSVGASEALAPLEDAILLLLVVLGGDDKALRDWGEFRNSLGLRDPYAPVDQEDAPFGMQGYNDSQSTNFQMLSLLVNMRTLMERRKEKEEWNTFQSTVETTTTPNQPVSDSTSTLGTGVMSRIESFHGKEDDLDARITKLEEEVRRIIEVLKHHGKGSYIFNLRDTVPLTPEVTPDLFGGRQGETPLSKHWNIYQDCFFLTPGLYDVLHDFVDEEEAKLPIESWGDGDEPATETEDGG